MTKVVEVLDALMGSGKTHAIIEYMSKHQDKPWLYISPMLEETQTRVPERASELDLDLFIPYEDKQTTKSQSCLLALERGEHICCTHNLMYKFSKKHLALIKSQGYRVVSDEELNLINGYSIQKSDIDFLINNKIIEINEAGRVVFLDEDMELDARYGDIKAKADLGMLYAAKRSAKMMVTQLSPEIIDASDRFILLTYNYTNSLMQTFLSMHNYQYKKFDEVRLWKTDQETKQALLERIEFIETPSVKKIQDKYPQSKTWWVNAKKEERNEIAKCIRSVMKFCGLKKYQMFYTVPKDYAKTSTGFSTTYIGHEATKNSSGEVIESTRTFIACNARSTNVYADKELAVHAYNLFPNQAVKAFIQGQGFVCNDEVYALNMMLQWLFRGCIRKKEGGKMQVAILSKRMSVIFKEWLMKNTK
jgi:hypothetical protein